jgi:hypothetical protein
MACKVRNVKVFVMENKRPDIKPCFFRSIIYGLINALTFNCDTSASSAIAKLSKPISAGGVAGKETPQGEKKETPQERLKRIMSKQLNKQSKYVYIFLYNVVSNCLTM